MSAEFPPRRVLGMMSGTSFDGVDAAVVETDGVGVLRLLESGFEPYSEAERQILRDAMGQWPSEALAKAHEVVLDAHGRLAARFDADLIGFHGQTLAHDPANGRTHQLGDGARLAQMTKRAVVWDFRTQDMMAGGQGAPLAPFFHHALARKLELAEPVAFLNLGGVANISWVDPTIAAPEETGAIVAFDTGPANALIDDLVSSATQQRFDQGGKLASAGSVNASILEHLDDYGYLNANPPKSLDRDEFASLLALVAALSLEDGAATLVEVTAECVARGMRFLPKRPARWFACGGGRHNTHMMARISDKVGTQLEPIEAVGLDGDMAEAQAFAWLAVRVLRGLPTSAPSTTGCAHPVTGGRHSAP